MDFLDSFKSSVEVLNSLVSLVDRLAKRRDIRRQKRYEELVRPIHEAIQSVHFDYIEMFRALERGLPYRDEIGELWVFGESEPLSEAIAARHVRTAKSEFEKKTFE